MKLCLSQEYELAARCVDRVLQMEPNNYQAKQLKDLITKKIRRGAYTVGKEGCVCVCVCVRAHMHVFGHVRLWAMNCDLSIHICCSHTHTHTHTDGLLGLSVLGGAAMMGGVLAVGVVTLAGMGIAKLSKK